MVEVDVMVRVDVAAAANVMVGVDVTATNAMGGVDILAVHVTTSGGVAT